MQVTGAQFTTATALARNDLATLPDFPAEIRAPAGTTYGVSGFQLHFGSFDIRTPGDDVDLLVAMNPAALKVNLSRLRVGGVIVLNSDAFDARNLKLAGYDQDPRGTTVLDGYQVEEVPLTSMTREALKESTLNQKEVDRCKNMFALGLTLWMYNRPIEPARDWITEKFARKEAIRDANLLVLNKGYHFGETIERFAVRYDVAPAPLDAGTYRAIRGVQALSYGLMAAAERSGLPLVYASYPITPASDVLHELSRFKHLNVSTLQLEDEIAAVGAAIGAAFGGALAITGTSGPGVALKSEAIGLAAMMELPLVIVNMQRGGPSTGLPTKTEQSDLLQAMYGRNGEAPIPIVVASTPGDSFEAAYEACRIAITRRTPVFLLSDGYLANGSEPWMIPSVADMPSIDPHFAEAPNAVEEDAEVFYPYLRDETTLARPWALPGTPGLEHRLGGLEKADVTGHVSYDPHNHEHMVRLRAEKVRRIADDLEETPVFGDPDGEVLLVGWGSTRGAMEAAVNTARAKGLRVGTISLRWVNPIPNDVATICGRFKHLVVPELNNGQLVRLLRDQLLLPFQSVTKIQGLPFKTAELVEVIESAIASKT